MKGYHILSGFTGAAILILVLLATTVWLKPFNYQAVYVVNPEIVTADSLKNDSLTCSHIAVLQDLENKGILLTPQEYTSHISSYYSTLVAFLIGLFILFTVGSIYGIRVTSRKEIEESKINIKDELKESLANELKDSKSFNENLIVAVKENMKDVVITKEDDIWIELTAKLKDIEDKQNKLAEDIELIYEEIEIDSKSEIKE
jgi:hypothetical protein